MPSLISITDEARRKSLDAFLSLRAATSLLDSLEGGRPLQLTEGAEYSWSPSWSPDGNKLAFYGLHDNKVSIGLWDRITGRRESFEAGNLYGRGSIEWDPQNQKIFFSSNPSEWKGPLEPYEDSEDPIVRTTGQETNPYDERFMSAYLSQLTSLDLQTKKTAVITPRPMEVLSSKFSPNRKHVAVLEIVKNKIRVLDTTVSDLVVYPTEGGEPKTVVADSEMTQFSWSPDSRFLAFVDKGKLFIYSIFENKTTQLSKDGMQVTGDPVFLPGAKQVFCAAGNEYYLFQIQSGKFEPVRMTSPYTRESYFLDKLGKFIYFKVIDEGTGKQGIYRISLKDNKTEQLILGDWMVGDLLLMDSCLLFTLQNSMTPENIWRLDLHTQKTKQISELNKQASDFAFGKAELVSWKSTSGDPLKGVLLYPANYEQGKEISCHFLGL